MLTIMNRLELKFYKELTLHERIADKQTQREHLAAISVYDHGCLEGLEVFPRGVRSELIRLDETNAKRPY